MAYKRSRRISTSRKETASGCLLFSFYLLVVALFIFLGISAVVYSVSFIVDHKRIVLACLVFVVLALLIFHVLKTIKRKQSEPILSYSIVEEYINEMRDADTLMTFFDCWDQVERIVENEEDKINDPHKKKKSTVDLYPYYENEDNFQWWIRNTIERQSKETIKRIKSLYQNSKEHKIKEYNAIESEIKENSARLSDETKEFADIWLSKVFASMDLDLPRNNVFPEGYHVIKAKNSSVNKQNSRYATLNGHDFEYWCADILRGNGFENVHVTKGSGDQGVDVLAEKGGIRYAIQCKYYSSPLGNTPIQEIHTGKDYYGCHVGVVMTNQKFTQGAIDAARSTNTLLWDGDIVSQMEKIAKNNSEQYDNL